MRSNPRGGHALHGAPRGQESTLTVNCTLLDAPGSRPPLKPQMIGPVPPRSGAVVGAAGGVQVSGFKLKLLLPCAHKLYFADLALAAGSDFVF